MGLENTDQQFVSMPHEEAMRIAQLQQEQTQRSLVRAQINSVADPQSREAIMSDVLGVMVVGLSQLTVAMSKAKTIEDIKAAAAPLAEIGAVIDAGVKSGAIKLPYTIKEGGAKGVLEKMVGLSNGVTAVLQASKAQA